MCPAKEYEEVELRFACVHALDGGGVGHHLAKYYSERACEWGEASSRPVSIEQLTFHLIVIYLALQFLFVFVCVM